MDSLRIADPEGLQFLDQPPPAGGEACAIVPGLRWLRMPLPFALSHINLWLLDDGADALLIDSGIAGDTTRALWQQLFDGPLNGVCISRMLVTHFHPDHLGLADWIVQRFSGRLLMTRTEWLYAAMLSGTASKAGREAVRRFYLAAGFQAEELEALAGQSFGYGLGVPSLTPGYQRLTEGSTVTINGSDWQVLIGRGHSPEHACLWNAERAILIAGDQILPSISPNISVWHDEPDSDPLGDFLETLSRLRQLPEDCLVLPSHGQPFYGLHRRIDALARHHADRLAETMAAAAGGSLTVAGLTRQMFPRAQDPHQRRFAIGEALAHLNHLLTRGQLFRQRRPDGVDHYVCS
jgi:glyoxylase-like metal-dependent hydrolase (beta-lactamase superfamily II)